MKKGRKQTAKPFRYEAPPMESSSLQETPLSMLELRQNAGEIMAGLESGVKYRLTYRGKTVGKILPVKPAENEISPDDAIFHLEDFVSKGPKGHLTNEEIDRAVYGL
jgi:antitoxin (DNA-binding transcriptional repressor) of toxin-antitoxin stability system